MIEFSLYALCFVLLWLAAFGIICAGMSDNEEAIDTSLFITITFSIIYAILNLIGQTP